ncbi:MAG: hypothetical protein R3E39_24255 [Anaerolineae bacterium]
MIDRNNIPSTLSRIELAQFVDFGETDAFVDMYRDAPPEQCCTAKRVGSAVVLMMPSLPIIHFDRVLGLGLNEAATPAYNAIAVSTDGKHATP